MSFYNGFSEELVKVAQGEKPGFMQRLKNFFVTPKKVKPKPPQQQPGQLKTPKGVVGKYQHLNKALRGQLSK